MRINEIKEKEVNVTLSADDLVTLTNVMYHYENHWSEDNNVSKPNNHFHALNAQIILASNVCQYGHMDSFATRRYVAHMVEANPEGELAANINLKKEEEPDMYKD